MANGRTGLVIKPIAQMVNRLQSLYQRPPDNIRGLDADSWYSPLQPVKPFAPPGTEPRGFQTWAGQNLIFTPRSDSEFSAADLKALATYPLARICISNVKDAVTRAPWEIQARPKMGETREERVKRSKGDTTITKLNRFFEYPDREHNWQEWLRVILDDLLVIDAAAILIRQTFKGEIVELPAVRGEMIVRYIDQNGFTPRPPDPAYAQNWWGLPLLNLTTDQLIYKPRNIVPRNTLASQLYGMSPTEELAPEIQIGIKRLQFVLSYYTEGSVPGVVQVVPRGTNPDRIEEAMDWMNSQLAGNLAKRNQWRLVQGFNEPGKPDQIVFSKEPLLAGLYDEKHIREIAFGYGTSPQRLIRMIRTEGKSSQESSAIEGTLPWINWVKGVIDYIIQVKMGFFGYEIAIDPYAEPDPLKNAAALTMLVSKGVLTPNEARKRVGEELRPEPEADRLGVITGLGFLPIGIPSVTAGVQIDDKGTAKPHPVKPTMPPEAVPRLGTPVNQEAGGGRSSGKNVGVPSGKESLDGEKIAKRARSRIEPDTLTAESHQAVHHIRHAVEQVFRKQHEHALTVTSHFSKAGWPRFTKRDSSVYFHLSAEDRARVLDISVDPADFTAKGREMNPHVTVLRGLHADVTIEEINKITEGIGDIDVVLAGLEAFPEGLEGVPLVIRVESKKLQQLREDLKVLPHTEPWSDYKPHICVAYLKPDAAVQDYVDAGNPLAGEVMRLAELVHSGGADYTEEELQKALLPSERLRRVEPAPPLAKAAAMLPFAATVSSLEQAFRAGKRAMQKATMVATSTIFLMRHGRTALDPVHRSDGWLDFPLSDDGRVRLLTAQQYMKEVPLTAIYCSDLKRTRETADIMASGSIFRPPVIEDNDAKTWNLGVLAGQKKAPNKKKVEWLMKHPDEAPEGGESLNSFRERFGVFMKRLKAKVRTGGGPVLAVLSGSALRELSREMYDDDDNVLDLDEGGMLTLKPSGGDWKAEVIFGHKDLEEQQLS